jgi:hypothetical protein
MEISNNGNLRRTGTYLFGLHWQSGLLRGIILRGVTTRQMTATALARRNRSGAMAHLPDVNRQMSSEFLNPKSKSLPLHR